MKIQDTQNLLGTTINRVTGLESSVASLQGTTSSSGVFKSELLTSRAIPIGDGNYTLSPSGLKIDVNNSIVREYLSDINGGFDGITHQSFASGLLPITEVGAKFTIQNVLTVSALRLYVTSEMIGFGPYTLRLWSISGTLLAVANVTTPVSIGWKTSAPLSSGNLQLQGSYMLSYTLLNTQGGGFGHYGVAVTELPVILNSMRYDNFSYSTGTFPDFIGAETFPIIYYNMGGDNLLGIDFEFLSIFTNSLSHPVSITDFRQQFLPDANGTLLVSNSSNSNGCIMVGAGGYSLHCSGIQLTDLATKSSVDTLSGTVTNTGVFRSGDLSGNFIPKGLIGTNNILVSSGIHVGDNNELTQYFVGATTAFDTETFISIQAPDCEIGGLFTLPTITRVTNLRLYVTSEMTVNFPFTLRLWYPNGTLITTVSVTTVSTGWVRSANFTSGYLDLQGSYVVSFSANVLDYVSHANTAILPIQLNNLITYNTNFIGLTQGLFPTLDVGLSNTQVLGVDFEFIPLIYTNTLFWMDLVPGQFRTANRIQYLPDASGTIVTSPTQVTTGMLMKSTGNGHAIESAGIDSTKVVISQTQSIAGMIIKSTGTGNAIEGTTLHIDEIHANFTNLRNLMISFDTLSGTVTNTGVFRSGDLTENAILKGGNGINTVVASGLSIGYNNGLTHDSVTGVTQVLGAFDGLGSWLPILPPDPVGNRGVFGVLIEFPNRIAANALRLHFVTGMTTMSNNMKIWYPNGTLIATTTFSGLPSLGWATTSTFSQGYIYLQGQYVISYEHTTPSLRENIPYANSANLPTVLNNNIVYHNTCYIAGSISLFPICGSNLLTSDNNQVLGVDVQYHEFPQYNNTLYFGNGLHTANRVQYAPNADGTIATTSTQISAGYLPKSTGTGHAFESSGRHINDVPITIRARIDGTTTPATIISGYGFSSTITRIGGGAGDVGVYNLVFTTTFTAVHAVQVTLDVPSLSGFSPSYKLNAYTNSITTSGCTIFIIDWNAAWGNAKFSITVSGV